MQTVSIVPLFELPQVAQDLIEVPANDVYIGYYTEYTLDVIYAEYVKSGCKVLIEEWLIETDYEYSFYIEKYLKDNKEENADMVMIEINLVSLKKY